MTQPTSPMVDAAVQVKGQSLRQEFARAIGDPNEVEFQRAIYLESRDKAKLERALKAAKAGYSLAAGEGALIVAYFEEQLERMAEVGR